MSHLYYEPPSNKAFEELREKAIKIWETYDNKYGYVDSKVNRIKDIVNFRDNFMYIISMFDAKNKQKLASMVSVETLKAWKERLD